MLAYTIVALVFWFNPLVSSIDILPDVIGYLLIIKAFSKASYVYTCASELCTSAKKMCIITGVKVLTLFMVSSFDVTMSLLLSFSFALLEIIFGVPFIIKLFDTVVFLSPMENRIAHERADKKKKLAISVFVIRLVLAVLPDLTALSLNDALTVETDLSYLRFRPLFILFSVFISLIISTVWLIKMINYFRKSIDKSVKQRCVNDFGKLTKVNTSLLFAKRNLRVITVAIIGSLFIFDFTWGYTRVDIFQDFMFPLLTLLGLTYLLLTKNYKSNTLYFLLIGAFVLQLTANIFEISANISYFDEYNLQSILKVSNAEDMYTSVSISAIFSSITFIFSSVVIVLTIKKSARESILSHAGLFSELDISYYIKSFEGRMKKHLVITTVLASLVAIMYSISVIFKPYAEGLVLLNTVLEVIYIISFISAALYIHDEVYKRILTFA